MKTPTPQSKMKVKYYESSNGTSEISFQVGCPKDEEGNSYPFDLVIVVNSHMTEVEDDKYVVLTFEKKQAKQLLKELKQVVGVVDCFG